MEMKVLTGTGISVSKVCAGTLMFGGRMDEAASKRAVDICLDRGVNFFDTSDLYVAGESERVLGKALKGRRGNAVLASKVGFPTSDDINDKGLSRRHIMNAVENSLKRLDTDYLDIYYMHLPDHTTPIEESLRAMDDLVKSGKVRYIGLSNFSAWSICDAKWISDIKGLAAPVVTEMPYNLLARGIEEELVPMLKAKQIGMCLYNPLAGGLLTGRHSFEGPAKGSRFENNAMYLPRYWHKENFDALEQLTAIAKEAGDDLLTFSLRWCLSHDVVDSVIVGFSSCEQLEQNLDKLALGPITDAAALARCDEVWTDLKGKAFRYHR